MIRQTIPLREVQRAVRFAAWCAAKRNTPFCTLAELDWLSRPHDYRFAMGR